MKNLFWEKINDEHIDKFEAYQYKCKIIKPKLLCSNTKTIAKIGGGNVTLMI